MSFLYSLIFAWTFFSAIEIFRLNEAMVQLTEGEKWCNVSYQNRIETRPCTINNQLPNVAKVEF
jgi:hypothetical protein